MVLRIRLLRLKKIAYFGVIFLIELNLQKNISEMESYNMIHSITFDTKKE